MQVGMLLGIYNISNIVFDTKLIYHNDTSHSEYYNTSTLPIFLRVKLVHV